MNKTLVLAAFAVGTPHPILVAHNLPHNHVLRQKKVAASLQEYQASLWQSELGVYTDVDYQPATWQIARVAIDHGNVPHKWMGI